MDLKRFGLIFLWLGGLIFSVPSMAREPDKIPTLDADYQLISSVIDSVSKLENLIALDSISPYWSGKVARQLAIFQGNREALSGYIVRAGKAVGADKSEHSNTANWKTVLRLQKDTFGAGNEAWLGFDTPFANARDTLMEFVNHPDLRVKFLTVLGSDSSLNSLTRPLTEIHLMQLEAGIARNEEKIRRYKIKYGPTSARLNLLETAINYWVLQKVPMFRSTENGPGHLEFIAAYSTAYLVMYHTGLGDFASTPALTSVFECGFRYYVFKPGWGGEGILDRMIKPAYMTFGGLLGTRDDGFLRLPGYHGARWGVFGSWGDMKLAWQGWNDLDHSQLLVSRQFQFIPYLF